MESGSGGQALLGQGVALRGVPWLPHAAELGFHPCF